MCAALRRKPLCARFGCGATSVATGMQSGTAHSTTVRFEAPPASVYVPVWQPDAERTTLALGDAGIGAIIWCIGFRPDFSWLDVPAFNGRGYPGHVRGVTPHDGLYFLGLPWLHTWGSGRFSGIARDAGHLADLIGKRHAGYQRAA